MSVGADRWIRSTTTGCVELLALIAGTVSYLHMHTLVALHGQPGWVAALTSTVSGRDNRRCLDDAARGLPVRAQGRSAAGVHPDGKVLHSTAASPGRRQDGHGPVAA